jgi:hypothetical protein
MSAIVLPARTAGASHFPHTKCASSGDYCVSVKKIDGVRKSRVGMLRYFRRHEVCVKGPTGERTCHTYRTRRLFNGAWGSSIDWREHYPFEGHGVYRVAWRSRDRTFATLRFHTR